MYLSQFLNLLNIFSSIFWIILGQYCCHLHSAWVGSLSEDGDYRFTFIEGKTAYSMLADFPGWFLSCLLIAFCCMHPQRIWWTPKNKICGHFWAPLSTFGCYSVFFIDNMWLNVPRWLFFFIGELSESNDRETCLLLYMVTFYYVIALPDCGISLGKAKPGQDSRVRGSPICSTLRGWTTYHRLYLPLLTDAPFSKSDYPYVGVCMPVCACMSPSWTLLTGHLFDWGQSIWPHRLVNSRELG